MDGSSYGGNSSPIQHYRPTWAEISEEAIRSNVRTFKRHLKDECKLMAVVKADGYGHGMLQVAKLALAEGATQLGVAIPEEAFKLRQSGITAPILILGYTPPSAVETAIKFRITMTVFTGEVIREIIAVCNRTKLEALIHLKVDTGMSRLGVGTAETLCELAALVSTCDRIILEGIFTHFAFASEEDEVLTERQFARFAGLVEQLEMRYGAIPIRHCCNTAATLRFPQMHMDMVRVGIGLYGLNPLSPAQQSDNDSFLLPAMQLKSVICNIINLSVDETVSYGGRFRATRNSKIAVLPIGYADGLPRSLSNIGYALVLGKRVPIVGSICMDQTMLDVTELPEVTTGVEAILIGTAYGASLTAGELADWTGTIDYEIVCRIGQRVPRIMIAE